MKATTQTLLLRHLLFYPLRMTGFRPVMDPALPQVAFLRPEPVMAWQGLNDKFKFEYLNADWLI